MSQTTGRVAIIGAGIAGLTAALQLARQQIPVTIFEASRSAGGLARSFPLNGQFIDAYYHFICRPDTELFSLLHELRLDDALIWRKTRMGLFVKDRLLPFGNPLDLVRFPFFSWRDRIKFARGIMSSKMKSWKDWKDIESIPAPEWLTATFGEQAYRLLHEPLIRLKFGPFKDSLSAAWIWARIFRVGKSRTIFQRELLGHLEGGIHRLFTTMMADIRARDSRLLFSRPVRHLKREGSSIRVYSDNHRPQSFDAVISTVSPRIFLEMLDNPPGDYYDRLRNIRSIAVQCMLFQLSQSFSPYFWMNVNDPRIPLAGLIETTNLDPNAAPARSVLLYAPQYLSEDDPRFSLPEDELREEYEKFLKIIRPDFQKSWILKSFLFRSRDAQPICETGFSDMIPAMETPMPGLFLTDSSQLHPDDRTMSNSVGLGRKAARLTLEFLRQP